ncbi:MAG: cytochrome c biogenesis protein [Bacteriovoracaceae bacterium]
MKKIQIIVTLCLSFFILQAEAQSKFCTSDLDTLPILAGGRVKPLFVHAKESLKFLGEVESATTKDLNPTMSYCFLSLEGFGFPNDLVLKVKVEHEKARSYLNMPANEKLIEMKALVAQSDRLKSEITTLKLNDSYKKELTKLWNKIDLYNNITSGADWKIAEGDPIVWKTLPEFLTQEKMQGMRTEGISLIQNLFKKSQTDFQKKAGDHYLLELTYVKLHFFGIAMGLVLLTLCILVLVKNIKVAYPFVALSLLTQVVAITMRVMISGRAPITNMYETVMFSGFGAATIALVISLFRKEKIYIIAGLSYNFLCLLMMTFANQMLNSAIAPLVPVLRDNFWLSTHVTMVILSYAALALSWVLANITMIKRRFGHMSDDDFRYNVDLAYTCIKVGVVMLSAGVILGGVWADYSWGRFWGWDPKETWSLIVLLIYMAILHGKGTSWINTHKFNFFVAGAFMSVMMAWFGVNYILASGLHSYGFSEGGAIFLGTFFLLQIVLLGICATPKGGTTQAT